MKHLRYRICEFLGSGVLKAVEVSVRNYGVMLEERRCRLDHKKHLEDR